MLNSPVSGNFALISFHNHVHSISGGRFLFYRPCNTDALDINLFYSSFCMLHVALYNRILCVYNVSVGCRRHLRPLRSSIDEVRNYFMSTSKR